MASGGSRPGAALAAILAGGALLVWPAFVNGYPVLFSDTGAFLHQTLGPLMIWDKPWVYGPLLHALHWRQTLWVPVVAQGLLVSHLLWLAARAWHGRGATPGGHLALVAVLALGTTAPWSAALLMPDILAPVTVLALALLGFAADDRLTRGERAWLTLVAALAIAAHLSHLPVAAALAAVTLLLARAWRPVARVAAPLGLAVLLLLATTAVGHGRLGLSPHGATFLLARLVADGPAARTVAAGCPGRGWYLCAWAGRLPSDSDEFLWSPDSPVNRDAEGRPRFLGGALLAPEAREILRETLRREPLGVARAMAANAWRQLWMAGTGDTLARGHVGTALGPMLARGFPAAEERRFAASRQHAGRLEAVAAPLRPLQAGVLVLGALGAGVALWRTAAAVRAMPRDGAMRRLGLLACVLVGVGANAAATGALSAPHHRYQARIAWLLPLAALLAMGRDHAAAAATRRPDTGRPGVRDERRPGARALPDTG
jgi:hypothetical protein